MRNITACGQPVKYIDDQGGIFVGYFVGPGSGGPSDTIVANLVFQPDNALDIGSPDAGVTLQRPRTVYVGTAVAVGDGTTNAGSLAVIAAQANSVLATSKMAVWRAGSVAVVRAGFVGGTFAAPVAVPNTTNIGAFVMAGYDGATLRDAATVRCYAAEAWGVGATGARLAVGTAPAGTSAIVDVWYWGQAGHYVATVDNTYDIGSEDGGVTLLRPRAIYVALGTGTGKITAGPADSGGAGFRALVVPN